MARKQFSKSDIKQFLEEFPPAELVMDKKSHVAVDDGIMFVGKDPCFIQKDNQWFPTLKLLLKHIELLPKLVVDMGAVKFVVNGADIIGTVGTANITAGVIDFYCAWYPLSSDGQVEAA